VPIGEGTAITGEKIMDSPLMKMKETGKKQLNKHENENRISGQSQPLQPTGSATGKRPGENK
jgi:hypothetical protein